MTKKILLILSLSLAITVVSVAGTAYAVNETNMGISVCDTGGNGFVWVSPRSA